MESFVGSAIINTAIPISLCVTLSIMYFQGITINSMSLGGLTIGIGMVVDNGNVVIENILMALHRNKHLPKKECIYQASSTLLAPILSSTITTIAIFIPFVFVAGMIGQLFKQLALTITYAMIASIFSAMFLVPRLSLTANVKNTSVTAGRKAIQEYFVPILKFVKGDSFIAPISTAYEKSADRFLNVVITVFVFFPSFVNHLPNDSLQQERNPHARSNSNPNHTPKF